MSKKSTKQAVGNKAAEKLSQAKIVTAQQALAKRAPVTPEGVQAEVARATKDAGAEVVVAGKRKPAKKVTKKKARENKAAGTRAPNGQGAGYAARKAADEKALKEAKEILKKLVASGMIKGEWRIRHFAGTRYVLLHNDEQVGVPCWTPAMRKLCRELRDKAVAIKERASA